MVSNGCCIFIHQAHVLVRNQREEGDMMTSRIVLTSLKPDLCRTTIPDWKSGYGKWDWDGLPSINQHCLPYHVHKLICILPLFSSWTYNCTQINIYTYSYIHSDNEAKKYGEVTSVFLISSLHKSSPTSSR